MNAQGGSSCPQGEEPGGEDCDERDGGQAEQYLGPQAKPATALSVGEGDALVGHAGPHDITGAAGTGAGTGAGSGSGAGHRIRSRARSRNRPTSATQLARMQTFMAPKATPPNAEPVKFDEILARLRVLVERLEGGNLTLEEGLGCFEEGIRLCGRGAEQLDQAEKRVEVLLSTAGGGPRTAPLAAPPDHEENE